MASDVAEHDGAQVSPSPSTEEPSEQPQSSSSAARDEGVSIKPVTSSSPRDDEQSVHTKQQNAQEQAETEPEVEAEADASSSPQPLEAPPYWQSTNRHQRSISNVSVESTLPAGAITLLDNEGNEEDDRNNACWAKSVEIVDYLVVNGRATTNIGAFVVWMIKVETLTGSFMHIRKRYSEFDAFRNRLVLSFPNFRGAVPELPPKSVISKFRPKFLEKRRLGLQYFLNCILLNPEFSGSPVLKEFLFE